MSPSTKLSHPAFPQVYFTVLVNVKLNAQLIATHTLGSPVPSYTVFFFFSSENEVNSPINIVFSCCLPTHCFQIIRQDYSTGFTINPLIPSLPSLIFFFHHSDTPPHSFAAYSPTKGNFYFNNILLLYIYYIIIFEYLFQFFLFTNTVNTCYHYIEQVYKI